MSGQAAFDKPVRPAALCRGETAENGKKGRGEETELNGVEEGCDEMSHEERKDEKHQKHLPRHLANQPRAQPRSLLTGKGPWWVPC